MAEDALKRYVLTVPEFPDGPYMAEHPAGAWVDHRDYRAMVEKFEVADQELRSYLADVSDQLIYARRDLAALRNDLAAAKQDASTAWERHAMANRLGNAARDELVAARRDLADLREDIESQIRIASEEATRAAELDADKVRLDWLDRNMFHREMNEWDARIHSGETMWVTFAPNGFQGSSRNVIDAAIAATKERA